VRLIIGGNPETSGGVHSSAEKERREEESCKGKRVGIVGTSGGKTTTFLAEKEEDPWRLAECGQGESQN